MPIRASLDGNDILAFQCDEIEWKKLKESNLTMPCCGLRAIPKKSKLGNYFFAHHRRGECTTAPESAEHIYLKTLIAKLAIEHGYEVITEKPGETPDGEKWIADVFCQKGKAKIAIEVQWSQQTTDEFIRRQKKYESSGVRAAWLFKLRSNQSYHYLDLPHSRDTPVFGMKYQSDTKDLYVPQFGKSIEEFVNGLLAGKLRWGFRPEDKFQVKILADEIPACWKCGKATRDLYGLEYQDPYGNTSGYSPFYHFGGSKEFIQRSISNKELALLGVGAIKKRYGHKKRASYLSKGCVHCDALFGQLYSAYYPTSTAVTLKTIELTYEQLLVNRDDDSIEADWYFDGVRANTHF